MQSVVDELAQAIRRPITLEDAGGRLLAYSVHEQPVDIVRVETLLRRGASSVTLEALRNRGVYRYVDSCDGIARVPAIPELGFTARACLAIHGPTRILGYLWVVDPDASLQKSAEEAIMRARHQLAVELRSRDLSLGARQEQRSGFVKELCFTEHGGDEALLKKAKALGWYHSPPYIAVVIQGISISGRSLIPVHVEGVLNLRAPSSLRGICDGEVIVVLSGVEGGEVATMAAELADACEKPLMVGAGGVCDSLAQVRRSYLQACSAISLGSKLMSDVSHFDYRTLAPYELLSCMANCKKAARYGREPVEKIMAYDELHGSNLFATLEVFLDHYGKRKQAAARLSVHPNTLDYRIGKIQELTNLDLDDPNTRLVAHIWVKALSACSARDTN